MIRLGPFRLIEPMTRGGMGEIWRAEHALSRTLVAVKVLTESAAREAAWRTTFRNEARSVAALDHPNIVQVLDYGEVDAHAAAAGHLQEGTPWMAMEMVVGGTLTPLCGFLPWSAIREVLEGILRALAHAHARGVLHRDIKPGNVLLAGSAGRKRSFYPKLTDFGLAHSLRGDLPVAGAVGVDGGTPAYMAPEQFEGRWRDYGPWTDLFALGGVAVNLLTGAPPHGRGLSDEQRRRFVLQGKFPSMELAIPVPDGLNEWLRGLLNQDPESRFACAADALFGLAQLCDPPSSPYFAAEPSRSVEESTLVRQAAAPAVSAVHGEHKAVTRSRPALDPGWREGEAGLPRASRLAFAGVGLFGVRPIPLVGRIAERDLLWEAFAQVEGGAAAVALSGPAGTGKSRLAQWLAQTLHERGAAHILQAVHRAQPGGEQGLVDMVARYFHVRGLSASEILLRLRASFLASSLELEEDAEPLSVWLARSAAGGSARVYYGLLTRLIEQLAAVRPVMVLLDDAHWGAETLEWVEVLLSSNAPILAVLTVSPEQIAARPLEEIAYKALLARGMREVVLQPLPPEDRPELVRNLLDLEPDLARRVEDRTSGNPLFAVQLVGDWVRRGQLVPGELGYKLRLGVELRLPASLSESWREQVERFFRDRSPSDALAVELGATLGQEVAQHEWQEVMARAGVVPSPKLLSDLETQQLIRVTRDRHGISWSFAHPMLWEVLDGRAQDAGRSTSHHAICVAVISEDDPAYDERLGRHLIGAAQFEQALQPLLRGVDRAISAGHYSRAEELLAQREAALLHVSVPQEDARWGEGWLRGFYISRWRGRFREARARLERLEREAERFRWGQLRVQAMSARGKMERISGDLDRALLTLQEAEPLALALGDLSLAAEVLLEQGETLTEAGRLAAAEDVIQRSLRLWERAGVSKGVARGWMALGELARNRGDLVVAGALLEWSRDLLCAQGVAWEQGAAVNSIGDIRRIEGRLDDAVGLYREAARLFRRVGSESAVYPDFNQGIVLVESGRWQEARPIFLRCLRAFEGLGTRTAMALAHVGLAICAAHAGEEPVYARQLGRGLELLLQTGVVDDEGARLVTLAAESGERLSPGWALRAYLSAAEAWRALGRSDEVEEIEGRLAALGA